MRRAGKLAISLTSVLVVLIAMSGIVLAIKSNFELDGDAEDTVSLGKDWDNVYCDLFPNPNCVGVDPSSALAKTFQSDSIGKFDDDIYTGGGSKDDLDINDPVDPILSNNWLWKYASPPPKDNIEHAFAAVYTGSEDGTEHTYLYFGADRYDNNGDAEIGGKSQSFLT